MVHMDVLHSASLQLQRVAGAEQSVEQRARPPCRGVASLRQHAKKNVHRQKAPAQAEAASTGWGKLSWDLSGIGQSSAT